MIYDVTVCFRHSNLEIRLNIQIYSSPHFFIEKGRILSSCPSRFRFRTSPYCLMVVLLPSWGNNKCRALNRDCRWFETPFSNGYKYQQGAPYSISQEICTRFLLCCALLWLYIDWFSHIHQAYFIGTVAILRLPQCQQSNPDEYG